MPCITTIKTPTGRAWLRLSWPVSILLAWHRLAPLALHLFT